LQAIPANSVVRHTTEWNGNCIADISRAIGISREERVILLHETLKKIQQTDGAVTNSVIEVEVLELKTRREHVKYWVLLSFCLLVSSVNL
jgi:hypothetical protein